MIHLSIRAKCFCVAFSPVLALTLLGAAAWRLGILPAAMILSMLVAGVTASLLSIGISNRVGQMIRSTGLIETGMPIRALDRSADELGQLAASLADVSAQVVSQKAEVIENKNRMEAIFRATKHVAIVAEDLAGQIILCNPGAEKLLGFAAGEMLGRPLQQVFHPEFHMQ